MKPEIENALRNIDAVCAGVALNREQHAVLARNIKLVHDALIEAEINAKPKQEKKNGKS